MKKKLRAIPIILTVMLIFSSCNETVEEPVIVNEIQETKAAKPHLEDDFYGYTNWDFIETAQIPYGKDSYSTFMMQSDKVDERLNNLIDEYSEGNPKKGTNEQKIKDVYLQYFDEDTRTKVGIEPFKDALEALEKAKTVDEFVEVSAMLFYDYGCTGIFSPSAEIDSYDSSKYVPTFGQMNLFGFDSEYVTDDDQISKIGEFTNYILKSFDIPEEEAKKRAKDVVNMIADIAYSTLSREYLFEVSYTYNAYSQNELSELYSNIDTKALLKAYGIDSKKVVVTDVSQSEKINKYLTEKNLTVLKDYATVTLFATYRSCLPPEYVKALDAVNESVFDKKKAAQDIVKKNFYSEFSAIYGEKFCSDDTLEDINKLVDDIKKALKNRIEQSDRLSDDGKKKLKKKLDNMVANIGNYDNEYSGDFDIISADRGGNLLQNVINVNKYNATYSMSILNHTPDRTKSTMGTQQANAVYNLNCNSITIPAAMMSDCYYDPDRPYAYNLGLIGNVVAHEMNHAFDSHGFLYDENGCYNEDWFGKKDKENYRKLQEDIIKYFNNYKLLDVYRVNGKITLGENIADMGAIECLSQIVDSKKDLHLLYEGFAYGSASLESVSSAVDQIYLDEHAPNEARVNAVLSTTERFYEAYNISENDGMYVAPENRVKVW